MSLCLPELWRGQTQPELPTPIAPVPFPPGFQALMSLFVLASKDGWVNIMYNGLDAVAVDQQVGVAGPGPARAVGEGHGVFGAPGSEAGVSHCQPQPAPPRPGLHPAPRGPLPGWCKSLLCLPHSVQGERCELAPPGGLQSPCVEN